MTKKIFFNKKITIVKIGKNICLNVLFYNGRMSAWCKDRSDVSDNKIDKSGQTLGSLRLRFV